MRYLIYLGLLLFFSSPGFAQEDIVEISAQNITQYYYFSLSSHPAWYFRKGNEPAWSQKEIDLQGWEKRNPQQLSNDLMDEQGRLEAWMRITLKLDDSFTDSLFLRLGATGQAMDLYINGEYRGSAGNTGKYGKPYQRSRRGDQYYDFSISPNQTYHIAIHYLHEPASFSPIFYPLYYWFGERMLTASVDIITFPHIAFAKSGKKQRLLNFIFNTVVILTLSLLYWLIYFLNPSEPVLKYIGLTFLLFSAFLLIPLVESGTIPTHFMLTRGIIALLKSISSFSVLTYTIVLAYVFSGRAPRRVWIYLLVALCLAAGYNYNFTHSLQFDFFYQSILIGLGIYYVFTNRKNLGKPQWAIIMGSVAFGVFQAASLLFGTFFGIYFPEWLYYVASLLITPASFILYIAFKYKEILLEASTQEKEKKEILENQNKVLEEKVEQRTQDLKESNEELNQRNEEISAQRDTLEKTLQELKTTQTQLVQAEKLASLGELTAGIAHEIQNPLNFVNNFSEVNAEMLIELKEELEKGDIEEVKALTQDLQDNEAKILHHGKRADAIVKNMLEHSRRGTGEKTLTDLNALADEYLRLAYHGLRAKDKSFNADFETHLDEDIPKIKVVTQDMSRVLLNLINNAFYAVHQKAQQKLAGYQPKVTIHSELKQDQIILQVQDNGTGMPDEVKEKIFQPFFTTKPTGQGTGLGLSLAYDIITKGHGGSLEVETEEGKGTIFRILLEQV